MSDRDRAAGPDAGAGPEHYRTERLVVRDWMVDDAPAALGIYGRDEVTRWLGAPPAQPVASLAAMRERVGRLIARNAERPGFGLWPTVRRDDVVLGVSMSPR